MPEPTVGRTGSYEGDDEIAMMTETLEGMLERSGRPEAFDDWLSMTGGDRDLAHVMSALEHQISGRGGGPMTTAEAQAYMKAYIGEWRGRGPGEAAPVAPQPLSQAEEPSLEGYSALRAGRAAPFAGVSTPFGEVPRLPASFGETTMGRAAMDWIAGPTLPDVQVEAPDVAAPSPPVFAPPGRSQRMR